MARDGAGPVRLVTRDLERRLELVINGDGSLTAETGVSGRQLRGEAPGEVGESAELDRGRLNNGQTERTYHQGPLRGWSSLDRGSTQDNLSGKGSNRQAKILNCSQNRQDNTTDPHGYSDLILPISWMLYKAEPEQSQMIHWGREDHVIDPSESVRERSVNS